MSFVPKSAPGAISRGQSAACRDTGRRPTGRCGTTLEREAGSTLHITCSLSLESGKAAVFLRSGADDPTILLSESGEYDGTVEVDGTSTYIGVWGDQADGTVSIEIE